MSVYYRVPVGVHGSYMDILYWYI